MFCKGSKPDEVYRVDIKITMFECSPQKWIANIPLRKALNRYIL